MPTTKRPRAPMVTMALILALSTGPALSDEVLGPPRAAQTEIRTTLLGISEWSYKWGQPHNHADPHGARGMVNRGKVWFAEKDGKLIG